jgi:hypothetical protein
MANPEHLEILKQGVEAWNTWRRANPSIEPDLTRASLSGAYPAQISIERISARQI